MAPFACAFRAMRPRHAVPLTTPKADVCLAPVYAEQRRATPLEPTFVEVFAVNSLNIFRMNTFCGSPRFAQFWCNLNPFRINTYKKTGGRVHFPLLTQKNEGSAIHLNLLTSLLPYFVTSLFHSSKTAAPFPQ